MTAPVTASGIVTAGKYFGGRSFDFGKTIASYDESYTFYTAGDTDVNAVFTEAIKTPCPTVTLIDNHRSRTGVSFLMTRYIPQGMTLLESGIIYTKDETDFLTVGAVNGRTVKVSKAVSMSPAGQYQLNVSTASGTVYAAAYVKYTDAIGKAHTLYTPVVAGALTHDTSGGVIDQDGGDI